MLVIFFGQKLVVSFHIQIWVKIIRALTSYYEEAEDGDMLEGFPKDSDGSAMIMILGVDRSIGAWNYLRSKLLA